MYTQILYVELFGRLTIRCGDTLMVPFGSRRETYLFAYLAYHAGKRFSREELYRQVWAEELEHRFEVLSMTIARLRKRLQQNGLPSIIATSDRQILLDTNLLITDTGQFAALLAQAEIAQAPERISLLNKAIKIYQGSFLQDIEDSWVVFERQRLADQYAVAVEQLISLYVQKKNVKAAIHIARSALTHLPYVEAIHKQLLSLYAASNDTVAAEHHYSAMDRSFTQRFGTGTSSEVRDLMEQIKAKRYSDPSLRSLLVQISPSLPILPRAEGPTDDALMNLLTQMLPEQNIDRIAELAGQLLSWRAKALNNQLDSALAIKFYSCALCYSRHNSKFAERLRDNLTACEIACWLDVHNLKGGEFWRTQIDRRLFA